MVRLGQEELLGDVARRAAALRHGAEPPEEELAFEHLNPVARAAIVRRLAGLRTAQGKAVSSPSELASVLQKLGSGQVIRLKVQRGEVKSFIALAKP